MSRESSKHSRVGSLENDSRGTGSAAVPHPGEAVQGRKEPCLAQP